MRSTVFILVILYLSVHSLCAQRDSIELLQEVYLSDELLTDFSKGIIVQKIADSTTLLFRPSLTATLRNTSPIYFRENGLSGVSSASFRGTNAAQTAVVWNGININSPLTGQTDFNVINATNFDAIDVRYTGAGVQYGSGAIGGTVHLSNELKFIPHTEQRIITSVGSFDHYRFNARTSFGKNGFSINTSFSVVDAENDYNLFRSDQRNENAAISHTTFQLAAGKLLGERHSIKFYHQTQESNREFAGRLFGNSYSPSNDSYKDTFLRNLIKWTYRKGHFSSTTSVAHLYEAYTFSSGADDTETSSEETLIGDGEANTSILRWKGDYRIPAKAKLSVIAEDNFTQASGLNIPVEQTRNLFSISVLGSHQLTQRLSYGVNFRQEFTPAFESPFLIGGDINYCVQKQIELTLSGSRNYRIPTFNDMYYGGAGGIGNPDLKPEESVQLNVGGSFDNEFMELSLNGFIINTTDMIQWFPLDNGLWSPVNIAETRQTGLEFIAATSREVGSGKLTGNATYGYTHAVNSSTLDRLIYVPAHMFNARIGYEIKRFSAFYHNLYTSKVFTTVDESFSIPGYDISNIGLNYTVVQGEYLNLTSQFITRNLFQKEYQVAGGFPMPGRSYQLQLIFNF
ncbi:TonB-dependent receptor [Gangjinia marincola]|uniref:TonB-dependent receptor n=1 Tax=Gangjinia marincola TaxID=578463 RepID=A0ABN1MFN7_9FLAO